MPLEFPWIRGLYALTSGYFFGVCRNFGLQSPMAGPYSNRSNRFVAKRCEKGDEVSTGSDSDRVHFPVRLE